MTDLAREINEYRVRLHLSRLIKAVNTTDSVKVPATAADLLDALYALTRHWRELDAKKYDGACRSSGDGKVVGGLTFLRGQAVHHRVVRQEKLSKGSKETDDPTSIQAAADFGDRFAEHFYDHYGSWNWFANAETSSEEEIGKMYRDHIAGHEVMITLDPLARFVLDHLPSLFE